MEHNDQNQNIDEKALEEFDKLLFASTDQRTEHASCLVDFLENKNSATQVSLLKYMLEYYGVPGRSNGIVLSGRKLHDDRFKSLARTLDEMIHGTIRLIIHSRKDSQVAAQMLRDLVFNFEDAEQRDYCLAEIMADDAIPYRPIPQSQLAELPQKRLDRIVDKNIDAVAQIRAVQRAKMETTATSELILRILQSIDDFEERVGVFETTILGPHARAIQKLEKRLQESR